MHAGSNHHVSPFVEWYGQLLINITYRSHSNQYRSESLFQYLLTLPQTFEVTSLVLLP